MTFWRLSCSCTQENRGHFGIWDKKHARSMHLYTEFYLLNKSYYSTPTLALNALANIKLLFFVTLLLINFSTLEEEKIPDTWVDSGSITSHTFWKHSVLQFKKKNCTKRVCQQEIEMYGRIWSWKIRKLVGGLILNAGAKLLIFPQVLFPV